MYKINHVCLTERLRKGVSVLEEYGYLKITQSGAKITALQGKELVIEKSQSSINIVYDTEPHFYMALIRSAGMNQGRHVIEPKVKHLGLMLDCSRNAVAKPRTVKRLICLLVLMGYDYLELYTEDIYELPDEPYFGHMRGRYSADELREIVKFADIFQMEMVPCIQTLAHMDGLMFWRTYQNYRDIDNIMLADNEKTYDLIRKILKFWKSIVRTNRINIGTDEAHNLGRGQYLDNNGYHEKHEIYLKHLKKVFEMCKEEGFQPEFWADAFYFTYSAQYDVDEVKKMFDGSQTPIYWEYSVMKREHHEERLQTLKNYAGKVKYAGALWKCIGYVPNNAYTKRSIETAFPAALEYGVEDILMTTWGDYGGECSPFAVISSMWCAAEKLFPCGLDGDVVVQHLTGYHMKEWELIDSLNYVIPEVETLNNAAKYLLHNDYLIGLMDYHIPEYAGEVYENLLPTFQRLGRKKSVFSYIFQSYADLCRVLIRKATFGKRLYQAYQEKNTENLNVLVQELTEIKKDLKKFYNSYRSQWMNENKGFGFEVMDVRIGGLISRADTVKAVLKDYLSGETEKIYELEEERLDWWGGTSHDNGGYSPRQSKWINSYTPSHVE